MHRLTQGEDISLAKPTTFREAQVSPQKEEWKAAMQAEINAFEENKTWTVVTLPPRCKALYGHWVYKAKEGPDGTIVKYKAQWVVKGYEQQYSVDYIETFASVVKPISY